MSTKLWDNTYVDDWNNALPLSEALAAMPVLHSMPGRRFVSPFTTHLYKKKENL